MAKSMIHLNGHVLCAVDVETTGLDPKKHDIIQIAVLPLDSNIQINKDYTPFDMKLRPERIDSVDAESLKISRQDLSTLLLTGMDPITAGDLLYEWFKKLDCAIGKKIIPLAHNWIFDSSFIREWLGELLFAEIFHWQYRDTLIAANFINDRADFHNETVPYPKSGLKSMATRLGIEFPERCHHDALADCVACAEVYRRLAIRGMFL